MVTAAPLRFLLVLVLAAWTTLCCCERRAVAEALFGGNDAGPASRVERCAPSCCSACASEESPGEVGEGSHEGGQPEHAPGCCSDGCCVKASTPPTCLELAVDLVGTELPSAGAGTDARGDALHRAPRRDLDEPHPPPWRILVVSARLRI